jgi:hypothetical protein
MVHKAQLLAESEAKCLNAVQALEQSKQAIKEEEKATKEKVKPTLQLATLNRGDQLLPYMDNIPKIEQLAT